jgi:hypothetical protein
MQTPKAQERFASKVLNSSMVVRTSLQSTFAAKPLVGLTLRKPRIEELAKHAGNKKMIEFLVALMSIQGGQDRTLKRLRPMSV